MLAWNENDKRFLEAQILKGYKKTMNESFPDENQNEPVSPSCSCHGADTSDATPSNVLNPDSGGVLIFPGTREWV